MFTTRRTGNAARIITGENGEYEGVTVGAVIEFVGTWGGEMYRGKYLHLDEKISPCEHLKAVFKAKMQSQLDILSKIAA